MTSQHQRLYCVLVGWRTIKHMDATTIWTLLSIFVIAPLGALAVDRPLFGNWIWHIGPQQRRDDTSTPPSGAAALEPQTNARHRQLDKMLTAS